MELVFILAITLLLVPLAIFTTGVLRIVLALPFLLFFPGYTLLAALFPRKESLDAIERIALSFALSMAVVPLIGLILNYTPWGIRLYPVMVSIVAFIIIASVIALYRRRSLPKEQRYEPHLHIKLPPWNRLGGLEKALSIVLVLSIIGAVGSLVYVLVAPRAGESFTEFYVLGSEGMAKDYPKVLALGEQGVVTLGIVNHEHKETLYYVEVRIDGEVIQEINDITLAQGQKWEEAVTLVPSKIGQGQEVDFLLYKGDESEPYRVLYLWLDVTEVP